MNNSNYIPVETRSIKLLYLIILIGLVGILMALLSMNMVLFAGITALPLICIAGILILRYPQLMDHPLYAYRRNKYNHGYFICTYPCTYFCA